MNYLQKDEFEKVREAPNAEIVWPSLVEGEFAVLEADMISHKVYIRCEKETAKQAISDTLTSMSQKFWVCRSVAKGE
jgi:hypothetical protein